MSEVKTWEMDFGGRKLIVQTGKLALQANASVTVQYEDTVVLATVVMSPEAREGTDFFPLMVEYEEKMYASGRIKGSRFIKREGRPSDQAVLTSRLVDRALRPLFDKKMKNDVQIIASVLSFDEKNDPDVPALIAGSIALSLSQIPWSGPIASCSVGIIDDQFVLNPTYDETEKSYMELTVAGNGESVIMLEAGAREVTEEKMYSAIEFANTHLQKVVRFISEIASEMKPEKVNLPHTEVLLADESAGDEDKTSLDEVRAQSRAFLKDHAHSFIFDSPKATKRERGDLLVAFSKVLDAYLVEKLVGKEKRKIALMEVKPFVEAEVTRAIIEEGKRVDGRATDAIRPLSAEVSLLPRTHGSGLFSRGETQVLSVVTLGSPGDQQIVDGMEINEKKRYMHHSNFPPFSVGEARPLRGPGRREIGHGALAERALLPVLPDQKDFPYTIRVVSEVLSSNGSSSMASVCGSSLALMDAAVPIKKPVAGIAMGLASNQSGAWKVITDLQDLEDGEGGMDFKIAGTRDGITAIQLDTKTDGLSMELIQQTFLQAHDARLQILDVLQHAIQSPRLDLSPYAPRIISFKIDPAKIGLVIGPGGKIINEIIAKTGVQIDIESDGSVLITSAAEQGAQEARTIIINMTREIKVGEEFVGKVVRVEDFGAFVELVPGKDGMVHISRISDQRIDNINAHVRLGDTLNVKVFEIDERNRINLCIIGVNGCGQEGHAVRQPRQEDSRRQGGGGYRRQGDFQGGARGNNDRIGARTRGHSRYSM